MARLSNGNRLWDPSINNRLKIPSGERASFSGYVLEQGELVVDESTGQLYIGDGVTVGGVPADQLAQMAAASALSKASNPAFRKLWLPSRIRQREVMASPPTVTCTTAHTITSPLGYLPVNSDTSAHTTVRLNPLFRYRRGSKPVIAGTVFPNYTFVSLAGVNNGAAIGSSFESNSFGVAVLCDGPEIEFYVKGNGTSYWIKVNGQYVSLTATTAPNDGSGYYIYVNFGSSTLREVELIGNGNALFGGVFASQTATVAVASPRGPRTIIMGDSFIEGTGVTVNGISNLTQVFADAMGWDDVRPCGIGGTGMLATLGGTRLNYRSRLAADAIAYNPDLIMLWGSINDTSGFTPSQLSTEAQALVSQIKASLPNCQIAMTSTMANRGAGFFSSAFYLQSDALKTVAASNGVPFINLLEQPTFETFDTSTTTLAATAATNATTISVNAPLPQGSTYKFADGTHFYVKSLSGTGPYSATIDNLATGQTSGAVITPCGNSLWTGGGKVGATTGFGNCDLIVGSDGTHPTDAGHLAIGTALAFGLMNVLN